MSPELGGETHCESSGKCFFAAQPTHIAQGGLTCSKAKEEDHVNREETQQVSHDGLKHKPGANAVFYLT